MYRRLEHPCLKWDFPKIQGILIISMGIIVIFPTHLYSDIPISHPFFIHYTTWSSSSGTCAPFHGGLRWHCEGLCIHQHLDLCTEAPANCGRSASGATGMGWGLAALAAPEAMSNPKDPPANKHYQTLPQTQNSQLKLVEILYNFEYVEICWNMSKFRNHVLGPAATYTQRPHEISQWTSGTGSVLNASSWEWHTPWWNATWRGLQVMIRHLEMEGAPKLM